MIGLRRPRTQSSILILFTNLIIAGLLFLLPSCGGEQMSSESKPAAGEEKAAAWTCPMHPEVKQSGPGKCPKCGMDLVPAKQ